MGIALMEAEGGGVFDGIAGLPMHPLVVHVAVVLLPLSALGVVLAVLVPKLRPRLATLSVLGVLVGAVAAFVAKESGESLEHHVGDPGQHAEYGDWAFMAAAALAAVSVIWWILQRRDRGRESGGVATKVVGGLAALAAVAAIGVVILAGHSGAEQVWKGTLTQTEAAGGSHDDDDANPTATESAASSTASAEPSGTQSDAGAAATTAGSTLATVAQHADRTSCWAAIDGNVYDLTTWIDRHPGGAERILQLCGTNATAAFHQEHGTQQEPADELAQFKIGVLLP